MKRYFCTYFDINYLPRALVMFASLRCHQPEATLFALCLDDLSFDLLTELKPSGLHPVKLSELEEADKELLSVKQDRRLIEYYFTISPCLPRYLLEKFPEVDILTYVDADLFFFASPEPLYQELDDDSVLIIPHRFPPLDQHDLNCYGIYNVGYLSFRNDSNGKACLNWWRDRCLDWCKDEVDEANDRFADQKYLDQFPVLFDRVIISGHKGANVAPWNLATFPFTIISDTTAEIGGDDLVFYHFQGLQLGGWCLYFPNLAEYRPVEKDIIEWLYPRYVLSLRRMARWMKKHTNGRLLPDRFIREGRLSIVIKLLKGQARLYSSFNLQLPSADWLNNSPCS